MFRACADVYRLPPRMVLPHLDKTEMWWLLKHAEESPIVRACRIVAAWCMAWAKKK